MSKPLHIIVSNIIDLHALATRSLSDLCGHEKTPAIDLLTTEISHVTRDLEDILETRITATLTPEEPCDN